MLPKFLLLAVFSWVGQAIAAISFDSFNWRADSRFELVLNRDSGAPLVFKGSLRNDEKSQVMQNKVIVDLKSYNKNGPFVTVVVTAESQDLGVLFILTQENGIYRAINDSPIVGRRASMLSDIDGILLYFSKEAPDKSRPPWSTANTFNKMKDYFATNPRKQLTDFYDEAELGNMKELVKPQPKGLAGNGRTVRTPVPPSGMADSDQYSDPQQQQQQPPRRQMQNQQPQGPYDYYGRPRGYYPPPPPQYQRPYPMRGPFDWSQNY